jgi:hypothetical protein
MGYSMNNIDKVTELQRIISTAQDDLAVLMKKKGKRFKPEKGSIYFIVTGDAGVVEVDYGVNSRMDNFYYDNFNCYETEELATKASPMMKRSNALIMACLQVDPNFVPDYLSGNQRHYTFYYSAPQMGFIGGWSSLSSIGNNYGPCVSTIEKWEEAAALLKEWGIE